MSSPDEKDPAEEVPEDPFFSDSPGGQDRGARTGFVPEFMRKMAVAGLGAIFMTEEGIRNLAGQLKLPKEALTFILSQADKTKDEVTRIAAEEIRRFMQSEKLRDEFLKLLSGMKLELKTEVRLVPDKESATGEQLVPKVTVTEVRAGRGKRNKDKE